MIESGLASPSEELVGKATEATAVARRVRKPRALFSYSIIDRRARRPSAARKSAEGQNCRCKRSQCMRLHCQCFQAQNFCLPSCRCQNCLNTSGNEVMREFVVDKMKLIDPSAFKTKLVQLDEQNKINEKGCSCKIGCNKNYCDCFKLKVGCSPICRCRDCKNSFVEVERKRISQIFRNPNRQKHRIMFRRKEGEESNETQVIFRMFKGREAVPKGTLASPAKDRSPSEAPEAPEGDERV